MAQLQSVGVPIAPKDLTLTERLNSVVARFNSSCNRIETVLAKVNTIAEGSAQAPANPTSLGTASCVEHLEQITQRLESLCTGLEGIA